jgi:hypothetical protein
MLDALPEDCVKELISWLPAASMAAMSRTCTYFRRSSLWSKHITSPKKYCEFFGFDYLGPAQTVLRRRTFKDYTVVQASEEYAAFASAKKLPTVQYLLGGMTLIKHVDDVRCYRYEITRSYTDVEQEIVSRLSWNAILRYNIPCSRQLVDAWLRAGNKPIDDKRASRKQTPWTNKKQRDGASGLLSAGKINMSSNNLLWYVRTGAPCPWGNKSPAQYSAEALYKILSSDKDVGSQYFVSLALEFGPDDLLLHFFPKCDDTLSKMHPSAIYYLEGFTARHLYFAARGLRVTS